MNDSDTNQGGSLPPGPTNGGEKPPSSHGKDKKHDTDSMKYVKIAGYWILAIIGGWLAWHYAIVPAFWYVVGIPSKFWNAGFWPGIETLKPIFHGSAPFFLVFLKLAALIFVLGLVSIFIIWRRGNRETEPKAEAQGKDSAQKPSLMKRHLKDGFKNWIFFSVDAFWAGAVNRAGAYLRVNKPKEVADLDEHGRISGYHPRSSSLMRRFLPGVYFKWPWFERVDFVYVGTLKAEPLSISINTAGVKEPPISALPSTVEGIEQAVPILAGTEIASANGPQTQIRWFILYEVMQVITYLRLAKEIAEREKLEKGFDLVENFISPNLNALLQDTLPDMLLGDIQRCPSEIFLVGTRDEIRGKEGSVTYRSDDVTAYWSRLLADVNLPFLKLDQENLDSASSREVVAELFKPQPYGKRQRRNCALVALLEAGGLRLRQFRKQEAEPEQAIREAFTKKGVAQVQFETDMIESRAAFAKELYKQRERIASAETDGKKVNIVTEVCKIPAEYKPFLLAFFQSMRTREAMAASKGNATTFVLGDNAIGELATLLTKLKPILGGGSIVSG